jgi:hypothetical protein
MTTASLRMLPLHIALVLGAAAAIATPGIGPPRAATHSPALASDTGSPTDLVNRPACGNGGDYETRPACEAGHW